MRNEKNRRTVPIVSRILAVTLALGLTACASGPPPGQIAEARAALEEAREARADELAQRSYDAAVRHLSVAESTWRERQDAATSAHWARRAEASARQAQYEAEARAAEEEIRRETERRNRAELAVRDAEIARLHAEARTEAEQRAAEAEQRAQEERRRRQEERERREAAAEQAAREAEMRREAEERAEDARREAEARADEERREAEARSAEERRRLEEEMARRDAERRAEEARAAEIARLQEEQRRTREELRAALSRLGEVRQEARGLVLTLPGSIYFAVNKSVVQPAMQSRLQEVARALAAAGGDTRILIEGHTDSDGSNEYNLELSRLRAQAVRSVLVSGGVPVAWIETQGYGETRPVAPNTTSAGKAQNRRVEVVVQGSAVAGTP